MGNSPVNASLSIDAGYIEAEVQRIVKAAIVETKTKLSEKRLIARLINMLTIKANHAERIVTELNRSLIM